MNLRRPPAATYNTLITSDCSTGTSIPARQSGLLRRQVNMKTISAAARAVAAPQHVDHALVVSRVRPDQHLVLSPDLVGDMADALLVR